MNIENIKYRGLSKEDKNWVYGLPKVIKNANGETIAVYICHFTPSYHLIETEIAPTSLMQYTGLKDRNGIDIYEGDVLKSPSECNIGIIKFDLGMFTLHSINLIHFTPLHEYCSGWEVIGNIHKNPNGQKDDTHCDSI